jgi:RimJ/RimL family protein N-acetyltransferase
MQRNRHNRHQVRLPTEQPIASLTAVKLSAEILTERLELRPPTAADAERIFARYAQDPLVCRYLNWTPHQSISDTHAYLQRVTCENAQGTSGGYLIFSRDSGELLGSVGGAVQETRVQFGYCLAQDAWGQGFATEAARAFAETVMNDPSIWRIQAFCDTENRTSARVLEKTGLTYEGTLRRYMVLPNLGDTPRDVLCYAKVRS